MPIATKSSRINISDEKKTKLIAEIFSKNIKSGDTLLFSGELGVGKTTFIKYLINSLQLIFNQSITEIPSPTFNLVNEYQLEKLIIKHYDFYRINDEKELDNVLKKDSFWSTLKAFKNKKLFVTDGNQFFNRPGPRLIESIEIFAEIIHPELFSFKHEKKGWINFINN